MGDVPRNRRWVTAGGVVLSLFALMAGQALAPPEVAPTVAAGNLAHARAYQGSQQE